MSADYMWVACTIFHKPQAAFLRKYELKAFLEKETEKHPIRQPFIIYRFRDKGARGSEPRLLTEKEFIG